MLTKKALGQNGRPTESSALWPSQTTAPAWINDLRLSLSYGGGTHHGERPDDIPKIAARLGLTNASLTRAAGRGLPRTSGDEPWQMCHLDIDERGRRPKPTSRPRWSSPRRSPPWRVSPPDREQPKGQGAAISHGTIVVWERRTGSASRRSPPCCPT